MSNIPAWQPHLEVWLLVAGVIGLGFYTSRVIQPVAVQAGGEPITTNQRRWFILGVFLLWLASDWPIHDISEERLYSMHMFQHMLLTLVLPPVMLMAIPKWLGTLILGDGAVWRGFVRLARPLPAAIIFNVVGALAHWNFVVNLAVRNGPFHYLVHTIIVITAFLAWVPVCGPFRELQMSDPGKMIYIFLLSIIPTVPAAFLTTADGVIYSGYDHGPRLWNLSVINDQQLAGVVMKVIEGFYLWVIILVMFLRWMRPVGSDHYRGRLIETHN